jgi:endonuclease YncB( thermonuclease family)
LCALLAGAPWTCAVGVTCPAAGEVPQARLAYVIDGDTLDLASGERVRLIGIDTPELGHDGAPDQPLAARAAEALRELTGPPGSRLGVQPGAEPRDRHGRRLAYLFDAEGRSLAEALLRQGLAYVAVIPPNLRYVDCLAEAQAAARRAGLGLWAMPALDAARLPPREGFMRVRGRVERVKDSRQGLWLELAGGMGLNVHAEDLAAFAPLGLDHLEGRQIEALGWVYRARGGPRLRLRHPSALILDTSGP